MTETLLVLHVLASFSLAAGVALYSAFALGAPTGPVLRAAAEALWGIGLLGTLLLGVWLALDIGAYSITDGWIVGALALWLFAGAIGDRARAAVAPEGGDGTVAAATTSELGGPPPAVWHWIRVAIVLVLLADMIWKPGT